MTSTDSAQHTDNLLAYKVALCLVLGNSIILAVSLVTLPYLTLVLPVQSFTSGNTFPTTIPVLLRVENALDAAENVLR